MALRYCQGSPNCRELVSKGRCEAHGGVRAAWRTQAPPPPRLRGRALQVARKRLFMAEPLCRPCKATGRVTLATIRDHITPVTEGGTEDVDNIQPICADCHRVKTEAESLRGVRRDR